MLAYLVSAAFSLKPATSDATLIIIFQGTTIRAELFHASAGAYVRVPASSQSPLPSPSSSLGILQDEEGCSVILPTT